MSVKTKNSVVDTWNFEPVVSALCEDGLDHSYSTELVSELKKFLVVAGENDSGPLGMAGDVDLAWHHAILNTLSYAELCEKAFGKFIHHFPIRDNGDDSASTGSYQRTLNCLSDRFGTLSEVWPKLPSGGTCVGNNCGFDDGGTPNQLRIVACADKDVSCTGGGTIGLHYQNISCSGDASPPSCQVSD